MTAAVYNPLEVRIVGFEAGPRRIIEGIFHRTKSENWSFTKCSKLPALGGLNTLWVVKLDRNSAVYTACLKAFLKQTKDSSPMFLLPDLAMQKSALTVLLREWLYLSGARVFEGRRGFDSLCGFLEQTAERDPCEIIVRVGVSDNGLHVSFADNAKADIPFAAAKRIAEVDNIFWDSIRIAGDRTYITLAARDIESIPIPHDVLREFVAKDEKKRMTVNLCERKLTAKAFGGNLRSAREKQSLTQEGLALKAETSRWTIHRIEKGVYLPKVYLLEKLARALKLEIGELLVR
jgi:DNA-binding XRE family transcriptional regulator